jgi:hypothetical protein
MSCADVCVCIKDSADDNSTNSKTLGVRAWVEPHLSDVRVMTAALVSVTALTQTSPSDH